MRKTPAIVFIFALAITLIAATNDNYKYINAVSFEQEVQMTTDRLGNAYVLVENQLLQFDPFGKPKANFSESSLGDIRSIDASNPMKILLFYSDFAKIIILDTRLAYQSGIDLRSIQINQPLAACTSEENGYWVYDRQDDLLKKLDMNLQVIYSSGSLTQIMGYQVQPGIMIERSGFIYMNNPATGILVFDRYGEYYKTIPYKGLTTFQVIGREILITVNNKLIRVDTRTAEEKEVLLPDNESIISGRIEQHQLYLLTTDSLKFYSF